jgi:hypothetical protein
VTAGELHREDGAWKIARAHTSVGQEPDPDALVGPTGPPAGPLCQEPDPDALVGPTGPPAGPLYP